MYRLRTLLFALTALAVAGEAGEAAARKRRPINPTKPIAAAVAQRPALRAAAKPAGLPAPTLPGAAFGGQGLAAKGFASGGLRSGLVSGTALAAECRHTCTSVRIACDDDPGAPVCAPRWAQCIAGCSR